MPYKIVKRKGAKPWKIIRKEDNVVVGSSTSKAKATRSAGYRMGAEKPDKKNTIKKPTHGKNKAYAKYRSKFA